MVIQKKKKVHTSKKKTTKKLQANNFSPYLLVVLPFVLLLIVGGLFLHYYIAQKKPAISIVMPVYNTDEYLHESISGVLNQTFKNFELILINDGSTDNSLAIMQKFAKEDKRIKLINLEKNSGAGAARNEGIKHITGKYTLFVDSDDFMFPEMLEKMYNQAEKLDLDMTLALAWVFNVPSGKMFPIQIIDRKVSFAYQYLQGRNIDVFSYRELPDNFLQIARKYVWDKLIKTALIKDNNLKFDNIESHNDTYFITMAMVYAKRIGYITDRVYLYRMNRPTAVSQRHPDDMKSVYFTFIKIKNSLKKMGIYDGLSESFKSWIAQFIPPEDWPLQQIDQIYRQKLIELRFEKTEIPVTEDRSSQIAEQNSVETQNETE